MEVTLQRFQNACLVVATTVLIFGGRVSEAAGPHAKVERPKLFVLVVFDQMRGDYLIRWQPHLGEDLTGTAR